MFCDVFLCRKSIGVEVVRVGAAFDDHFQIELQRVKAWPLCSDVPIPQRQVVADASRCKDRHRRCWFACDWPSKSANGVVAPLSCVRNPMKLFQQLLVAPAALGLMASGANAAELNINGVSDYAASACLLYTSPSPRD